MLKNPLVTTPNLSYWSCDRYPYYIPSIKSIERILAPFETGIETATPYDELHIFLKGTATYKISNIKTQDPIFYNTIKNDIVFLSSGMQKYIITESSDDCELLKIKFSLYTCHNLFTQSSALDFDEALNSSIENRRLAIFLPTQSHFHYGDNIHNHISEIMEEFRLQNTGYTIQVQTHLLQLILAMLKKAKEKSSSILENVDHIGITSKYSPYTAMKKGAVLSITNIDIFSQNPNLKRKSAELLSVFDAKTQYKLDPSDDNLQLRETFDHQHNKSAVELTALDDTIYHVWLSPATKNCLRDLRPYGDTGYIRFYAKCNTEMRFGIVVYNHTIHKCIIHAFNIQPSKGYLEYCIPITGSENLNKPNPHIPKIINYIESNFDHKILLEDIAAHTHLNASYLSLLFKEQMGVSISDYILDHRLSIAKNILINSPESPISEVALSAGFYDTAHFSKAFKNHFGVTARQYRSHGQKETDALESK